MKKETKRLVKLAESLGYVHADTNCKGARRYEHPERPDILISQAMPEHTARALTRDLLAGAGKSLPVPKRNPAAIRDRQARERAQLRQDQRAHGGLLARLRAERDRMLSGHAGALTDQQVRDIEASIERTEREVARFDRLMTEIPAARTQTGAGRARHQAGAR